MRSIIRTNPLAHAAAAFVVGGLAVLVVHQRRVSCEPEFLDQGAESLLSDGV